MKISPGGILCTLIVLMACSCEDQSENDASRPPVVEAYVHSGPELHVQVGDSIQAALEKAAESGVERVIVHAGTYRPSAPQQALIWFNERHDGILLEADGEVVLTAANPEVAKPQSKGYPAIVNHVVYFGHKVGARTTLRGFKITGANNFVTTRPDPVIQPGLAEPGRDAPPLSKTKFFYSDGGGIKIFGASSPTIENCEIFDNHSYPCGAGISVEQRGFNEVPVTIRNCIFRGNHAPMTGAALDLLDMDRRHGSSAVIDNCLFIGNLGNGPREERHKSVRSWSPKFGHGAITVFPPSRATVTRSTFVGNRNGVDDHGANSTYTDCIFWKNTAPGGWPTGGRYDFDITNGRGVTGCMIGGVVLDLRGKIDPAKNNLDPPDPRFDATSDPKNDAYRDVGYRSGSALASD
ncbi:MAG: hypothetical protein ACI9NC_000262 [Verrucomicrobiales bacterium]|jgi:hypothetical protein